MLYRTLGQDLKVSAIGLGCMAMVDKGVGVYGKSDEKESLAVVHRAIELGVTFFDTAEVYGPHINEEFVGRAIAGHRHKLVIATKFGFRIGEGTSGTDSSPENVRRACEGSLRRLGTDYIDLFYQHRVDPNVPIEETVGAMAELVAAGKVRHIGLSEPSAATIARAHAVHPLTAVQSEYSLWERGIEPEILPAMVARGIGLVPYSPLGRGFLAGAIRSRAELAEGDYRLHDPRYSEENFDKNMGIVQAVRQIAGRHGASAAQVALAWLLAQGDHIVPIPGVKRLATMEDSIGAAGLELTVDDLADLAAAIPPDAVSGPRYGERAMSMVRL
jgi:aryl-alcohol dehydrogenase-like predicted oxidoreductase